MSYFDISETDLKSLDGKVAIVTGASSGIGLATAQLFLSKNAIVIGVDLQPPTEPIKSSSFSFQKADVKSWSELTEAFSGVYGKHGRIDIVFANAGIGAKAEYLKLDEDSNGRLLEPSNLCLEINFHAVANQISLAAHYMQRQAPKGGNIVLTSSCTGYQKFGLVDYVAAKHGVIGLLRSFSRILNTPEVPIRINAVAPSWTLTGLVPLPAEEFEDLGLEWQSPHVVSKSVALLVCDEHRHGQCLYSRGGKYVEMEEPMLNAMLKAIGRTGLAEEDEREKIIGRAVELAKLVGNKESS